MAKTKSKDQKRKARIRKAKPWVATYQGSDILLAYSKRFGIDLSCATKDLAAMKASTAEQREQLKQAHEIRKKREQEERTARLIKKLEKRKISFENEQTPAELNKALKESKPSIKKSNPKRRCANCNRAMKQQFIGLKHCKCGTSWSKSDGYFERTPGMVFALQRKVIKKSKNSVRTKQVPVIRYKGQE